MFIVYKVLSPSNKIYIGITSRMLSWRKKKHIECAKRKDRTGKFQKAILKYKNKLKWEVLETNLSKKEAILKETYYIQKYDSYKNGYNCTLGGESNFGWKPSEETKLRMSKAAIGRKFSKKHKDSLSKAQKKYRSKKQNRIKMAIEKGAKPFLVFTLNGKFIAEYISKTLCSEKLGIQRSNIRKVLQNKRTHAGGFKFVYKENYNGTSGK